MLWLPLIVRWIAVYIILSIIIATVKISRRPKCLTYTAANPYNAVKLHNRVRSYRYLNICRLRAYFYRQNYSINDGNKLPASVIDYRTLTSFQTLLNRIHMSALFSRVRCTFWNLVCVVLVCCNSLLFLGLSGTCYRADSHKKAGLAALLSFAAVMLLSLFFAVFEQMDQRIMK